MNPNAPTEVARNNEVTPPAEAAASAQKLSNDVYTDKGAWDALKSAMKEDPAGFKLNNMSIDFGEKAGEQTQTTPKSPKELDNEPKGPYKPDAKPDDNKQPAFDKPGKGLPEDFDVKSQIPPELLREMPKAPVILGLPDMKNPITPEIKRAIDPGINPPKLRGAEPEKKSIWDDPIWKEPIFRGVGPLPNPYAPIQKL